MIENFFISLKDSNNSLNKINVIDKIKLYSDAQEVIPNIFNDDFNYIASHFEEMKDEIINLKNEDFISVLNNPHLLIKSEESLWDIIKNKLKKNESSIYNDEYYLQFINIRYLSNNSLKDYFTHIKDITNLNQNIWNILIKCICSKCLDDKNKTNIEEKSIFEYLNNLCSGNAYLKGLIDIQTTPTNCSSPEVVISPSTKYWYSRDGSNDLNNNNWIQIDEQLNNNDLNGPSYKKSFSTSINQYFRYIRLRGSGCNHRDDTDFDIVLSHFEIFGLLSL